LYNTKDLFKALKASGIQNTLRYTTKHSDLWNKLKLNSEVNPISAFLNCDKINANKQSTFTSKFLAEKCFKLFKDPKNSETTKPSPSETNTRHPSSSLRYKRLAEKAEKLNDDAKKKWENTDKIHKDKSNRSGGKSSKRIKIKIDPLPITKRASPQLKTQLMKTKSSSIRRIIKTSWKTISQNSNQKLPDSKIMANKVNRTLNVSPYEGDHDSSSQGNIKFKSSIIDSLIKKKLDENTIVSSTNSLSSKNSKSKSKYNISRPSSDILKPDQIKYEQIKPMLLSNNNRHKSIKIRSKFTEKLKQISDRIVKAPNLKKHIRTNSEKAYQNSRYDNSWDYFENNKENTSISDYKQFLDQESSIEIKPSFDYQAITYGN